MDQTISCAECGKTLRSTDGKDLEDIHTSSDGEDVCGECCDVCNDGSGDQCVGLMLCAEWDFAEAVSIF